MRRWITPKTFAEVLADNYGRWYIAIVETNWLTKTVITSYLVLPTSNGRSAIDIRWYLRRNQYILVRGRCSPIEVIRNCRNHLSHPKQCDDHCGSQRASMASLQLATICTSLVIQVVMVISGCIELALINLLRLARRKNTPAEGQTNEINALVHQQ